MNGKQEAALKEQIDTLYKLREKRLALNKEAEAIKTEEVMLRAIIVKALVDQGEVKLSGSVAEVELDYKAYGEVEDWEKLYKHIQATGEFDLIHRRLTDTAVRARWEAGDQVPGVKRVDIPDISLSKLKPSGQKGRK